MKNEVKMICMYHVKDVVRMSWGVFFIKDLVRLSCGIQEKDEVHKVYTHYVKIAVRMICVLCEECSSGDDWGAPNINIIAHYINVRCREL